MGILGLNWRSGGGGGSQTPSQILETKAPALFAQGLALRLDPRTDPHILGLTNGAPVCSAGSPWVEPVSSYNLVPPYTGGSPTLSATGWSDGGSAISFVPGASFNSGQALQCNALHALLDNGGSCSLAVYLTNAAPSTTQVAFGASNNNTPYKYVNIDGTFSGSVDVISTAATVPSGNQAPPNGASTVSQCLAPMFSNENTVLWVDFSAGPQSQAFVNGQRVPLFFSGDGGNTYANVVIGGFIFSTDLHPSSLSGLVRRMDLYSPATGTAGFAAWVYSLGLQSEMRVGWFGAGDSILVGFGVSGGQNWFNSLPYTTKDVRPTWTGALSANTPSPLNDGSGGRSLVYAAGAAAGNYISWHMVPDLATYVPDVDQPQVIIIQGGHNDIVYANPATMTPALIYGYLQQVIALTRAASPHAYIVVCTLLEPGGDTNYWATTAPQYAGDPTPYTSTLHGYNLLLRAGIPAGADALLDLAAIPGVTYQSGLVHPDLAGQMTIAAAVPYAAIRLACVNKWLARLIQS